MGGDPFLQKLHLLEGGPNTLPTAPGRWVGVAPETQPQGQGRSLGTQLTGPDCAPAVMVATQQEMNDAQLKLDQRDYCAHYLIRLLKCKRDSFPNFLACKHERHDWDYCEHLE